MNSNEFNCHFLNPIFFIAGPEIIHLIVLVLAGYIQFLSDVSAASDILNLVTLQS